MIDSISTMKPIIPDSNMNDHSKSFQKKLTGFDSEFAELLWKNGNPLIHSPSLRKLPASISEVNEEDEEVPKTLRNPMNLALEDEMGSWFQYPSFELLEKEMASDFFCNIPNSQSTVITESTMPPPKPQFLENRSSLNFPHFSRPAKIDINNRLQKEIQSDVGESSSMMTMGSGICDSNQVPNFLNNNLCNLSTISLPPQKSKEDFETRTETYEATGISSPGGSMLNAHVNKRKEREVEEAGSMIEEEDYESADGKKPAQGYHRRRAAEVHNLSERKRRDKINEKMKALQDLIPNCTKTDKASMLDEAIEYLKSLQLQLQIMWMASGMGSMMFPGNLLQFPQIPVLNRYMPSALSGGHMPISPQSFTHLNFPNQMHIPNMSQSFAPYFGFHHLQPSLQAMNLYYESQMRQQKQMQAAVSSGSLPPDGFSSDKIQK